MASLSLIGALALLLPCISAINPLALSSPLLHHLHHRSSPQPLHSSSDSYAPHNISVPLDHFHNDTLYEPHSNDTLSLRYWFDASHYSPGGPVVVIAAGETDGADRIPFLAHGIVADLAARYHGIGLILEHRYYGESYPEGDLTPSSLRFLSTDQALADYAYVAQHISLPGLEHLDLTAGGALHTPWFVYGGSYAGAFAAFLRQQYPDVYWGAVSSSGVTAAIEDYWLYFEPVRNFAPAACILATQTYTHIVDRILIDHAANKTLNHQLKSAFGMPSDLDDVSFANLLSYGVSGFQGRNWDPAIGSPLFREYCSNITAEDVLYNDTVRVETDVQELMDTAGYDRSNTTLVHGMLNYIGFLNQSALSTLSENGILDASSLQLTHQSHPATLNKTSEVSWGYQVCTEWGYFVNGKSVPDHIRPLISRVIDLPSASAFCALQFGINTPPDVQRINRRGGFDFAYPRVALIDGLADPWREATPHATGTPDRKSTDDQPYILVDVPASDVWDGIRGAVHHWDQNGLTSDERKNGKVPPRAVQAVQEEVIRFVGVWLKEFEQQLAGHEGPKGYEGQRVLKASSSSS